MESLNRLYDLSPHLFWDMNLNSLDSDFNKTIIIERVFDRGDLNDIKIVINLYGIEAIKAEIIKAGNLDKKTLNWASNFLKIPKNKFRCYKKIHSKQVHWNF